MLQGQSELLHLQMSLHYLFIKLWFQIGGCSVYLSVTSTSPSSLTSFKWWALPANSAGPETMLANKHAIIGSWARLFLNGV